MRRAEDKANYTVQRLILLRGSLTLYKGDVSVSRSINQQSTNTGTTYSFQLLEEPVASLNIRRLKTSCEFCVVVHISIDTRKAVVTNLHEPLA